MMGRQRSPRSQDTGGGRGGTTRKGRPTQPAWINAGIALDVVYRLLLESKVYP